MFEKSLNFLVVKKVAIESSNNQGDNKSEPSSSMKDDLPRG
jgi:hypothetical protein